MKKRNRRCDPEKQRHWEEVLRRWRAGGQSVRAFCRAEGVRESAFYFWRRELARRGERDAAGDGRRSQARAVTAVSRSSTRIASRRDPRPSFLPVRVVAAASGYPEATAAVGNVEIVLAKGRTVRVPPGFDRQTLADVVREKRLYGSSSEKFDPQQGVLFDPGQGQDEAAASVPPSAASATPRHRHRHARGRIPDETKREEEVHDLTDAEKAILGGAENLVELPPETSEQLDWRPSTLFVTVHVRKKYARKELLPESGLTLAEQNVVVAKKPPEAIPGALAGPGLMAQVIVSKGADHLPLHRLEGIFKRQGVRISRQTMDGWWDIDNNEGENSLRGLCLGRKNWLFLGSDRGGRAAAVHFSLLASCKRHGHDPWVYYRDVLVRLPAMLPGASDEELLAFLPHRWRPA